MVAGGLPTVQVLLDNGVGGFPYDVTTYVRMVDGITRTLGRQDELAQVTPGQLNLVLDNTDGRFTLGSTIIASPSPVVVDQRIRVKVTANATTVNWFTGYVQQWPVDWPSGDDTFSTVTVLATDAQARAERWVLKSLLAQEVAVDAPEASYTLSEPAGAVSAADSSGNQASNLAEVGSGTAVAFGAGTGPGTDGLTAATFADGQYLAAPLPTPPAALEIWFSTTTNDALKRRPFQTPDATGPCVLNGLLSNAAGTGGGPAIAEGLVHQVVWQGTSIYLDGALTGITATALTGSALIVGLSWIGSLSNVIAYTSTLSAARITAHYQAGKTGFAGESGTARITRLAGYASIPLGSLDTSLTNVAFEDTTGKSAAEAIRDVATAEMGLTFFDGSGNLIFYNRNQAPLKTTPDLTIDANQLAEDTAVIPDTQGLLNYFEAIATGTGVTQVVRNTVSELGDGTATHPGHGRYPGSASYLVQTDAEALDRGNWTVANHAEPPPRLGSLPVTVLDMTAAQQATVLGLTLNAWIRVTGLPSQTPGGTTLDLAVVGFSESISATEWKVVYNVVPRSFFTAWILDNTTYSVLGTTTKLYV